MKKQLSICIPTYNRVHFLKECLDSILESAKGYEDIIEIVISDNASTDETQEAIAQYRNKFPHFRVNINRENIGGENNFYKAAVLASSEYIWIFGDDDYLLPIAIPTVINKINAAYNLIICNFSILSKDLKKLKKYRFYSLPLINKIYHHDLLLKTFGLKLGYISSSIIRKDIFLKTPWEKYVAYSEYRLSFLYAIYSGLLNNTRAAFIDVPLFFNRAENYRAPDWAKIFIEGAARTLNDLKPLGYSSYAVKKAKNENLKNYVFPQICKEKIDCKLNLYIFYQLYKNYKDCWAFWGICLPIIVIPKIVLKQLVQFSKSFLRKKLI